MKLKQRRKPIKLGSLHIITDWWHFFFPSKNYIQRDGGSFVVWNEKGEIESEGQVSYTLRNYAVRKWYEFVVSPARRLAEGLEVAPELALQIGAIAFDATAVGIDFLTEASPHTLSHTCTGANRLLWHGGGFNNTASDVVGTVTYDGTSMTKSPNGFSENSLQTSSVHAFLLDAPSTGANTTSMPWDGTNRGGSMFSSSYTGCKQTTTPDSDAAGGDVANGSGDYNISTTVVASDCWMIGQFISQTSALGAASGTTLRDANASATAQFFFTGDSNGTVATGSQELGVAVGSNKQRTGWVGSFAPV